MLASGRSLYGYAFITLLACGGSREYALQVPQPVSNVQAVVSVTTDRQTYTTGEVIELTLELQNNSDQPLLLYFTTGQRYDFSIRRTPADTVWSWSKETMFMLGIFPTIVNIHEVARNSRNNKPMFYVLKRWYMEYT